MRLVTKNIIRRIFQDIAEAFDQINSFGYGQLHELPQLCFNEDDQTMPDRRRYPILFVSPDIDTIQGKTIYYGYKIVIADLVRTGEQNETEVESDTFLIIQDVIAQIQDQDYGFLLDIDNIQIEPFTERFADLLTGHIATVRLKTAFQFNRCQIPSSFISISNPYIPLNEEGTNERDPLSWHKTGNTLTASSTIGSNNDQDWRIIHNNLTIATIQAAGIAIPNIVGDVVISGSLDYDSGAIQSLNALTNKVQTFAVGSSGTDFTIVSAAGVHTFNIPSASTTNRGLLTTGTQQLGGDKELRGHLMVNDSGIAVANSVSFRVITDGNASGTQAYLFQAPFSGVLEDLFSQNQRGDSIFFRAPTIGMDLSLRTGQTVALGSSLGQYSVRTASGTFYGGIRWNVGSSSTTDTACEIRVLSANALFTTLKADGNRIGFFGATPVIRPTINAGSTAAVLAALLVALENLGLIVDNT